MNVAASMPGAAPVGANVPAVTIRGLSKRYGDVPAVSDVNLVIERGEFFSLLGPSGCGKTSLLRIIGGFESLDSGQVLLDGRDVSTVPAYARNTNMIFQNLALFPHMTVLENIAFGLRRKGVGREELGRRVDEAISLVRLQGYQSRMPDQLSGGQRQRVAMARALVNQPSVLLLDEPLGALDLQLRLKMQEDLRSLQRTLGNTFIFVTHDQGEAMAMSDRIAIMNQGRIQQVGTPEEIYENPKNRFVAEFVGHTNLLDGTVRDSSAHGRVNVECRGTIIPCRTETDLADGQPAVVALRYEKLDLAPDNECSSHPVIFAVVSDRTYLGGAVRLHARAANGLTLTGDITDTARVRNIAVGDSVRLTFAADAAVAVADAER
ncbi:MAG: spermidine/putrescine import ABC transporter ATP-binding protein PotA [Pseudolabrys sp.]|nr:spermidine/putrescine import ABC transporter ATP-binding protein PotA [Pseudolabrys sp.]